MATETSKVDAFVNALADALGERAGLAGVKIFTSPDSAALDRSDCIQFIDAEMEQEWGMLGNRRREEMFTWHAAILCSKGGKTDAVARALRARCFEILGEIEDCLRVDPTVGSVVKVSQLKNGRLEQGANSEQLTCDFVFDIEVKASLASS